MNTNDSFNQTKTVTARIVSVHKNRFQIALDSAERKAAEHDAVLAGRLLYRGYIVAPVPQLSVTWHAAAILARLK